MSHIQERITQIDETTWRVLGSTGNPYAVRHHDDGSWSADCPCGSDGYCCAHIAVVAGVAEGDRALSIRSRPGRWHSAPDGTPCCCTAEDRRYGCGCR